MHGKPLGSFTKCNVARQLKVPGTRLILSPDQLVMDSWELGLRGRIVGTAGARRIVPENRAEPPTKRAAGPGLPRSAEWWRCSRKHRTDRSPRHCEVSLRSSQQAWC